MTHNPVEIEALKARLANKPKIDRKPPRWESCPCCHNVPGRDRDRCLRCGGFGKVYA